MVDSWKYSVNKKRMCTYKKTFFADSNAYWIVVEKFINQLKLGIKKEKVNKIANYSESKYIRNHLVSSGE